MRIEVICTGDEVLTGKIVNTNFSYITQKLEDFGLSVTQETTVGDDRDSLLAGHMLTGPALVDAPDTTIWVPAGMRALIDPQGTLVMERETADASLPPAHAMEPAT